MRGGRFGFHHDSAMGGCSWNLVLELGVINVLQSLGQSSWPIQNVKALYWETLQDSPTGAADERSPECAGQEGDSASLSETVATCHLGNWVHKRGCRLICMTTAWQIINDSLLIHKELGSERQNNSPKWNKQGAESLQFRSEFRVSLQGGFQGTGEKGVTGCAWSPFREVTVTTPAQDEILRV